MFSNLRKKKVKLPRIGPYVFPSVINTCGFGNVLLGLHENKEDSIAVRVKDTKLEDVYDGCDITKIYRAIKALKHPHIIPQYMCIVSPWYVIDITGYASEMTLISYFPEDLNDARRVFQQLMSAVDYCHRNMLVLRNIKLENILVDERFNIILADFDFSVIMEDGKFVRGSGGGTKQYTAPELLTNTIYDGRKVDIFSCGICLATLVVRGLSRETGIPIANFHAIEFCVASYFNHDVYDLVMSMQDEDPRDRATMEDIKNNNWFKEKLPSYLFPDPERKIDWINSTILKEVCKKCKVSKDEARSALVKNLPTSKICFEYCLAIDNWRVDEQRAAEQEFFSSRRSEPTFKSLEITGTTIVYDGWILQIKILNYQKFKGLKFSDAYDPQRIMTAVYVSLNFLSLEWKVISEYHLLIRRKSDNWKTNVKMELQIYYTTFRWCRYIIRINCLPQPVDKTDESSGESSHRVMNLLEECSGLVFLIHYQTIRTRTW